MNGQHRLDETNLLEYLRNSSLLVPGEEARIEVVGDGNVNWVRRVRSARGSRVVKQARPALERFPEYRVSTERLLQEARFYELARPFDRDGICPQVLHVDTEQRVLVLEDLGDCERLDAALERGADVTPECVALANFLGRLHVGTCDPELAAQFPNDEMRRLHGDHIFRLPFRPNDFSLSPAVAERAREIQADTTLVASVDAAHARYLASGRCLIHGDVQPANVLLAANGPKLLDAEIAQLGDPAFDIGQLLGHLLLPAAARGEARAVDRSLRAVWQAYAAAASAGRSDLAHAARYAGVELLRRTLGAARVPAVASDAASLAVIDAGLDLIRNGEDHWGALAEAAFGVAPESE
ncbi:MAG: phosphotransferase [Deltaproteobacteria bacterium]|nr:phosphotransferase [Deltaproteobacteria bacterium]